MSTFKGMSRVHIKKVYVALNVHSLVYYGFTVIKKRAENAAKEEVKNWNFLSKFLFMKLDGYSDSPLAAWNNRYCGAYDYYKAYKKKGLLTSQEYHYLSDGITGDLPTHEQLKSLYDATLSDHIYVSPEQAEFINTYYEESWEVFYEQELKNNK